MLLLYAARGVRGFGDGFAVIILPAYLSAIGFTPVEIGIVATAALLGSSLLTLAVGFVAPRHDLRNMLMLGAALMVATGIVFPQVEHIAFVLLVAFVGTINPQSGDPGVLVPLEHAMLARGVADARPHARLRALQPDRRARDRRRLARRRHARPAGGARVSTRIASFQAMFYAYAALGLVGAALYRRLPHAQARGPRREHAARAVALDRLQARRAVQPRLVRRRADRAVAAGAVAVRALRPVARRPRACSSSGSSVLTAFSYPVAAWLSQRIGLINTMVFTHIPSSLFLILAAFSTNLYRRARRCC